MDNQANPIVDISHIDQQTPDTSSDLNEIINELDMTGMDELDLSSFLTPDSSQLTPYYQRDILSLASSSSDPFNLISSQTENILKPLQSLSSLPQVSESEPQQYWGHKRNFNETQATNFELPSEVIPQQTTSSVAEEVKSFAPAVYNLYPLDDSSPLSGHETIKSEDDYHEDETDKGGKRRKLTAEEKAEKRKQQTRTASKLYRQRRKELEKQLSERLDELEKEKRALIQEKKAADEMLKKLKEENEKLRTNQRIFTEETAKKRIDLLVRLQKQLNENASDDDLKTTIAEIHKCNSGCGAVGRCNLSAMINPASVQQLVAAGFFEQTIKSELSKKGTIEDLVEKVKNEVKTLTPVQLEAIENAVFDHNERLRVILAERDVLASEITQAFKKMQITVKDSKEYLEIVTKLEHLRKSLQEEGKIWGNTLHVIGDEILTPKQHAQFLVRVEFQQSSVKQLTAFWSALNKTLGPQPTMC